MIWQLNTLQENALYFRSMKLLTCNEWEGGTEDVIYRSVWGFKYSSSQVLLKISVIEKNNNSTAV